MNVSAPSGTWMTIACLCGCSGSAALSPASGGESPPPASAGSALVESAASALFPVSASELSVTSGVLQPQGATGLALRSATVRAVVGRQTRDEVEIAFVYRGPSRAEAPLASGEMRRQVGVKLRARDSCNVVYVMWHIEPTPGIHVSVKSNPGMTTHAECGDSGYIEVTPSWGPRDLPPILVGEQRTLQARIGGRTLRVDVDGTPAWVGSLPPEAFGGEGPVGLRSDNGEFDVQLRASARPHAR